MQYQVPQFIDRETRLLGPLTVRQTLLFGGIAAILFVLYFLLAPFILMLISVLLLSMGTVVAFVRINGRPLSTFLFSFLGYFISPKLYLWKKRGDSAKAPIQKKGGESQISSQQSSPLQPIEIDEEKIRALAQQLNEQETTNS